MDPWITHRTGKTISQDEIQVHLWQLIHEVCFLRHDAPPSVIQCSKMPDFLLSKYWYIQSDFGHFHTLFHHISLGHEIPTMVSRLPSYLCNILQLSFSQKDVLKTVSPVLLEAFAPQPGWESLHVGRHEGFLRTCPNVDLLGSGGPRS